MDMDLHSGRHGMNDHREHTDLVAAPRDETRAASTARRPAASAYGSGWYHDAAIEQASRAAIETRCNPYA